MKHEIATLAEFYKEYPDGFFVKTNIYYPFKNKDILAELKNELELLKLIEIAWHIPPHLQTADNFVHRCLINDNLCHNYYWLNPVEKPLYAKVIEHCIDKATITIQSVKFLTDTPEFIYFADCSEIKKLPINCWFHCSMRRYKTGIEFSDFRSIEEDIEDEKVIKKSWDFLKVDQ